MCNRFAQYTTDPEAMVSSTHPYLDATLWNPEDEPGGYRFELQKLSDPRFNVAPTDTVHVLYRRPGTTRNVLQPMRWGLIPRWAKKVPRTKPTTHNARTDTILKGESKIWNRLVTDGHRCVVPANGFFMWTHPPKVKGKKTKTTPYYVKYKDGGPMFFAGLWEAAWKLEGHKYPLFTFTILTTESSDPFAFLGDRMPVILETEADITRWLDPDTHQWSEEIQTILTTYEGDGLELYPVPTEVGNAAKYNNPSCVKPVAQRDDGIDTGFKRQADPERPRQVPIMLELVSPQNSPRKRARKVKSPTKGKKKVVAKRKGKEKEKEEGEDTAK